MSQLTNNPDLDNRTRSAIAAIEVETTEILAAADKASAARHLANVAAWEDSLTRAIATNAAQLEELANLSEDDPLIIACRGLGRCYVAALSAARTIRARIESALGTTRLV